MKGSNFGMYSTETKASLNMLSELPHWILTRYRKGWLSMNWNSWVLGPYRNWGAGTEKTTVSLLSRIFFCMLCKAGGSISDFKWKYWRVEPGVPTHATNTAGLPVWKPKFNHYCNSMLFGVRNGPLKHLYGHFGFSWSFHEGFVNSSVMMTIDPVGLFPEVLRGGITHTYDPPGHLQPTPFIVSAYLKGLFRRLILSINRSQYRRVDQLRKKFAFTWVLWGKAGYGATLTELGGVQPFSLYSPTTA